MKKNLVIIDFLSVLTENFEIDCSIQNIIENDRKNEYIFISEDSYSTLKSFLPKLKVVGFYMNNGCSYFRYEKDKYILDYQETPIEFDYEILFQKIRKYPLPYESPKIHIFKEDFYYSISLVGSKFPQSYLLYYVFPIELYQKELKLQLELLCIEYNLDVDIINLGLFGFYIIPKQFKKKQILSKLSMVKYKNIFFFGKRNFQNTEIMDDTRLYDFEVNSISELREYLKDSNFLEKKK